MDQAKEKLVREFEELKSLERHAYEVYQTLYPLINKEKDQEKLKGIMADELNHEKIVGQIIETIKE